MNRPGAPSRGLVVSESAAASRAGADLLARGGNAVDAAVGAAFALAATSPWGGNLAGGTLAVVRRADGREVALDARECAPARAHRGMFLDGTGRVIPERSTASPLAVAVPGTVDGLLRLWTDHGSGAVGREELLAPAVHWAREGAPLGRDLARRLNEHRSRLAADSEAARIFVRSDRPWREGDRLVQHDLAAVLEEIARRGREGFHHGWVAERLAAAVAPSGILSAADLAAYRSRYREPVEGRAFGHRVVSAAPPSAGGALLIHILHMLETFPREDLTGDAVSRAHLLAECLHLAHADRAACFGDPDAVAIPLSRILSPDYARERAARISRERAAAPADLVPGVAPSEGASETTHLSAIDAEGNAVALTTTLNDGFGCARVAAGTGVLLNNGMDDFTELPGAPNLANAVAPGKRPQSGMTPALAFYGETLRAVLGSPGGPRILSAVLQVLLNVLVLDMPIARAVAAPRIHAQGIPHVLYAEADALTEPERAALGARGHRVEVFPGGWIGRVNAVAIESGMPAPGPDVRRGDNAAAGA